MFSRQIVRGYSRSAAQFQSVLAVALRRVLISDEIDDKCVNILRDNGIEVEKNTKLAKEKDKLKEELPKYDGLIVRSATKVTKELIEVADNLKIIGRAGTGVDNIDTEAATKKGVIVMKHVAQGVESMHAGRWDRKKYMGHEVYNKTLGIIGLGHIGREVAKRMQAFGMKTVGFDPLISAEESAKYGIEWMTLDQIWPQVDYITLHTPLIPATKNLINDEVFKICKKGLRVINVARGGIVDEDALLRALESGQCGGAALDVFLEEPPKNQALINHPLMTATPHLGASTHEAQTRVAEQIAEQFVSLAQGQELLGGVNAQAWANAMSGNSKPLVDLATALGSLGGALASKVDSGTQVKVSAQGLGAESAASSLSTAVLVGMLKQAGATDLNLISAGFKAKELGIQVDTEHSESPGDIEVTVEVGQQGGASYRVKGQTRGSAPTLTELNGATFSQGATLQGEAIVYSSKDAPQALAGVTSALASAGVGVQGLASSTSESGENWSVIHLASPVSSVDSVAPHVSYAQKVSF